MELPDNLKRKTIGGNGFTFDCALGTVTTEQKWSETHVWGGGGGGYVGKHGGNLNPVHIQSSVELNQEIWLELPDGPPYCLQVQNFNIQALGGHPLAVVSVHPDGQRNGAHVVVSNLATGMYFQNPGVYRWLAATYAKPTLERLGFALALPLVMCVIAFQLGAWGWAIFLLIGGMILGGKYADSILSDRTDDLRIHSIRVSEWIAEELIQASRSAQATTINPLHGEQPSDQPASYNNEAVLALPSQDYRDVQEAPVEETAQAKETKPSPMEAPLLQQSSPSPQGTSVAGLILGVVSVVSGGISLLLFAMLFGPTGLLSGIIAAFLSFRRKYVVGGVLSVIGLLLSGFGLATSPMFWLTVGSTALMASRSTPPAIERPKVEKTVTAPKPEPKKEEMTRAVEGEGRVLDAATLSVAGKKIPLFGAVATNSTQAETLQDFLKLQGGLVRCEPKEGKSYACFTANGVDIAEAAILNGAAKASISAPDTYLQRQAQAKERRAGIWSN